MLTSESIDSPARMLMRWCWCWCWCCFVHPRAGLGKRFMPPNATPPVSIILYRIIFEVWYLRFCRLIGSTRCPAVNKAIRVFCTFRWTMPESRPRVNVHDTPHWGGGQHLGEGRVKTFIPVRFNNKGESTSKSLSVTPTESSELGLGWTDNHHREGFYSLLIPPR